MKLSYRVRHSLGVQASSWRKIKSGSEYNHLFPKPKKTDPFLTYLGNTFHTIDFMGDIVNKTLNETKKIAPLLKGKTLKETTDNIWHFMYRHYQYKIDKPNEEELRSPARAWSDRVTGIDCDCYSITISSILLNLGIPHVMRKAKYNGKSYFQHIYIIVPKKEGLNLNNRNNYYVIDPVLDKPNYEKPYSEKFDKTMMPIRHLNGIHDTDEQLGNIFKKVWNTTKKVVSAPVKAVVATVKAPIQATKALVTTKGNVWDRLKSSVKAGVADPTKSIIRDHVDATKSVVSTHKAIGVEAGKVAKKVWEAAKKITIKGTFFLPRAGLLLAMKINLARMAERLGYGYWTEEEAKAKGLNLDNWRKIKEKLAKVEKIWRNIEGEPINLKNAILQGWEHGVKKHNLIHGVAGIYGLGKLSGLAGLGEITDPGYVMMMGFGCPHNNSQKRLNGLLGIGSPTVPGANAQAGSGSGFTPEEMQQLYQEALKAAAPLVNGIAGAMGNAEEELSNLFTKRIGLVKRNPTVAPGAMTPEEFKLLHGLFHARMNGLQGSVSEVEVLAGIIGELEHRQLGSFFKKIGSAIKKVTSAPIKAVAATISAPIRSTKALVTTKGSIFDKLKASVKAPTAAIVKATAVTPVQNKVVAALAPKPTTNNNQVTDKNGLRFVLDLSGKVYIYKPGSSTPEQSGTAASLYLTNGFARIANSDKSSVYWYNGTKWVWGEPPVAVASTNNQVTDKNGFRFVLDPSGKVYIYKPGSSTAEQSGTAASLYLTNGFARIANSDKSSAYWYNGTKWVWGDPLVAAPTRSATPKPNERVVKPATVHSPAVSVDLNRVLPQELEYIDPNQEITIETDDYEGLEIYGEDGRLLNGLLGLSGGRGLGEGITLVAGTTAAAGFIAAIASLLRGIKGQPNETQAGEGANTLTKLVNTANDVSSIVKTIAPPKKSTPSIPTYNENGELVQDIDQEMPQTFLPVYKEKESAVSETISDLMTPTNMAIGGAIVLGGIYMAMRSSKPGLSGPAKSTKRTKSKPKAKSRKVKTIKI